MYQKISEEGFLWAISKTVALNSAAHFLTLGLTIDDSTAYGTAGGGGGIAFRTPRNSSGTQTVFAAIDGAKEGTSNDGYTGALRFYTNQNSTGVPLERMRITSDGKVGIGSTSPYSNSALTVSGGIRFSTNVWASGNAFNVTSWATYNVNTEVGVGAIYNKLAFLTIYHSNGQSHVFFLSNAGGGVAYQFTAIRPDSGSPEHPANDFTITTDGSAGNAFRIRVGSGNGSLSVERTSGSTTFGLALHVLSG